MGAVEEVVWVVAAARGNGMRGSGWWVLGTGLGLGLGLRGLVGGCSSGRDYGFGLSWVTWGRAVCSEKGRFIGCELLAGEAKLGRCARSAGHWVAGARRGSGGPTDVLVLLSVSRRCWSLDNGAMVESEGSVYVLCAV